MKKKILQLISPIGCFGAENVLLQLCKELSFSDYACCLGIIGNKNNSHEEVVVSAKKDNLELKVFDCSGKFDLKTIQAIRKYVKENKIDVIHSHGYKSNLFSLLAAVGTGSRKFTTCHNWLGKTIKMKFYARLDKFFLKKFDKVVAVSEVLLDEIARCGVPKDKIVVIHNGVNTDCPDVREDTRRLRASLGISEENKIILSVGRLSEEKGLKYLLDAAQTIKEHNKNIKLIIAGDGPLRNELEVKAKESGLGEHVFFLGVRDDIPVLLQCADVFVLPSLVEAMPMALLEAMAAAKPVVASEVGSVPEIIKDGYSGILAAPGDTAGLARAIESLLADWSKAESLAEKAFETVKRDFSSKAMGERYMEVYEQCLN